MQMTLRTFYVLISFFATWKHLATWLATVQGGWELTGQEDRQSLLRGNVLSNLKALALVTHLQQVHVPACHHPLPSSWLSA